MTLQRASLIATPLDVPEADTRDAGRSPRLELRPELYRIRDAAAVLGVSPRMVYSFIEAGELRPVRLPGTGTKRAAVRIARADLLAFVDRLRGVSA